jgi:hypothetical protein
VEHVLPVRVDHFTLHCRRLIDHRWLLHDDRRAVDEVRIRIAVAGVWVAEIRVKGVRHDEEADEVMEAVVAVVMAVMAVPAVPPPCAGFGMTATARRARTRKSVRIILPSAAPRLHVVDAV